MDEKVVQLTVPMKRHLQAGVVSIHSLMHQLLLDFGVDLRDSANVTLSVSNPGLADGLVCVTGNSASGGQVGNFTLPTKMLGLTIEQSWGHDAKASEETSDDEEGCAPEGATIV